MRIATFSLGPLELDGELNSWRVSARMETAEPGIELLRLDFRADAPAVPPHVTLRWSLPLGDIAFRWHPMARFNHSVPPDWGQPVESNLAASAPVIQWRTRRSENRLIFAVSDAMRPVKLNAGICEESATSHCLAELFAVP